MEPLGLTYSDTGKALGGEGKPLSRTSIFRLVRDGELEKFKVGGRALIAVDSLKRYINQQRTAA